MDQVAALDHARLGRDREEAARHLPGQAPALHAQVGLEPEIEAEPEALVVEEAAEVADARPAGHDHLGRERATGERLGRLDQTFVDRPLLGQPGVEVVLDQRLGGHERLGHLRAQDLLEPEPAVVAEAARRATLAAGRDRDRLRLVLADELGQHLLGRLRVVRRLEEAAELLLGEAGDRHLAQPPLAGVDEDEQVAAADVGPRRRHVLGERVLVELLVDDDPHADAVPAHEVEQEGVAAREPAVANRHLLAERRREGRRRRRFDGDRRGGGESEQPTGDRGREQTAIAGSMHGALGSDRTRHATPRRR